MIMQITTDYLKEKIIEKNNPKLEESEFKELVNWAVETNDFFEEILKEHSPSICACLGPILSFSMCPCSLRCSTSKYRFEIAYYVMKNNIEIVDNTEKRRLENEEFAKKLHKMFAD